MEWSRRLIAVNFAKVFDARLAMLRSGSAYGNASERLAHNIADSGA